MVDSGFPIRLQALNYTCRRRRVSKRARPISLRRADRAAKSTNCENLPPVHNPHSITMTFSITSTSCTCVRTCQARSKPFAQSVVGQRLRPQQRLRAYKVEIEHAGGVATLDMEEGETIFADGLGRWPGPIARLQDGGELAIFQNSMRACGAPPASSSGNHDSQYLLRRCA